MGKSTNQLGKAVANHLGYTVRMMCSTKTDDKTKKTIKQHNGKFGIYAGKNKIEEAANVDTAMKVIEKIVSDKSSKK